MESTTHTPNATEPHAPCPTCGATPAPGLPSGEAERSAGRAPGSPILGLALAVATVLGVLAMEVGAVQLQPTAVWLITGSCLGAVLIGCGLSAPLKALDDLCRGREGDLGALRPALHLLMVVGPLSGLLGAVMGFIHVMQNLSDPRKLGWGLALSVLPLLYGLVVALVAYALDVLARRRSGDVTPVPEVTPEREGAAERGPGRPLLGTALLVVALLGAFLAEGGPLHNLLGAEAAVLVFGVVLAALVMTCRLGTSFHQMFSLILGFPLKDDRALRAALEVTTWAAPVAGALGMTLGSVHCLSHLEDPTKLGAGVALAFLSAFYAGVLALLGHAFATLTRARAGEVQVSVAPPRAAMMAVAAAAWMLLLLFIVLWAITFKGQ